MTDKNSSPHIAALQELEAALDAHRRTQAAAGAPERALRMRRPPIQGSAGAVSRPAGQHGPAATMAASAAEDRTAADQSGILNPVILIDRRHPWLRKLTFTAAGAGRGGSDRRRRCCGGGCSAGRSRSTSRRPGSPPRSSRISATAIASKSAARCSSATRRGARRCGFATSCCATRRGLRSRSRPRPTSALSGTSLLIGKPARRKLPAGRCQHDDPDRPGRTGQRHRRRREAVQRDRADAGAAGHDARSGQSGAISRGRRNACAGPRGSGQRRASPAPADAKPRQRARPRWPNRANSRSSRWPSAVLPTTFPRWSSGSTSSAGSARDGSGGFDGQALDRHRSRQRQPHHRRPPQQSSSGS